jgi:hypothetical protein
MSGRRHRRPRRGPEIRRRTPPTFGDLPAAQRVWIVDHVYDHIAELHRDDGEAQYDLDDQTVALLTQLKLAICDDRLDQRKADETDRAFLDRIDTLPLIHRDEAERRYVRWMQVLDTIPTDATCPADWFRAMVRRIGVQDPDVTGQEAAGRLRDALGAVFGEVDNAGDAP